MEGSSKNRTRQWILYIDIYIVTFWEHKNRWLKPCTHGLKWELNMFSCIELV